MFYGAFESPTLPSAWYSRNVPRIFINRGLALVLNVLSTAFRNSSRSSARENSLGSPRAVHSFHGVAKLFWLHRSGSNDDCVDCVRHANKLLKERSEKDA
jgi:hypothetical protein